MLTLGNPGMQAIDKWAGQVWASGRRPDLGNWGATGNPEIQATGGWAKSTTTNPEVQATDGWNSRV